jgi:hypothetical protein
MRIVARDLTVDVATVARTWLPPFHGRGLRAQVNCWHLLDAAFLVAAMIDADVEACHGIGPVEGIVPRLADCCDVGRRGGNSGDADQLFLALDLLRDRARIGDLAETAWAELAVRQQNVGVNVPVVMRRVDRDIGGDAVPADDRRQKIHQQPLALRRGELVRQSKLKLGRNPSVDPGLLRLSRIP